MLAEEGFGSLVAHGSYTMNLCTGDPDARAFAADILKDDLRRIVFGDGHHRFFQMPAVIFTPDKIQYGCAEGIIHNAVQRAVGKVSATDAVADFVGSILPNLTYQQRVGTEFSDPFFQPQDKGIR